MCVTELKPVQTVLRIVDHVLNQNVKSILHQVVLNQQQHLKQRVMKPLLENDETLQTRARTEDENVSGLMVLLLRSVNLQKQHERVVMEQSIHEKNVMIEEILIMKPARTIVK